MSLPPYSLKEFWSIIAALSNDLRRCTTGLQTASQEKDAAAILFWRRMCTHAVCAAIEGAVYHMTYIAYVARRANEVVFSLDELERLEKAYDFDPDSEAEAGLSQAQMYERITFAFNAFARVHYTDYVLPVNDPAWPQVKEIFAIKNRLSHPQSAAALEISDDHVTALLEGTAWFMTCMVSLLESSQQSVEERVALLEEAKDELIM